MVAARGHHAISAAHGREALDLMGSHRFDMVLLDIMMPVMNGYELLAVLADHPELQHVPVVVVSAISEIESVARCIALGAIDYLFKPVDRVLLGARIDTCLVRKHLRDREQAAYAAVHVANQAKSEFVSLVAHELKNPLAAIRGYADMLRHGSLGPMVEGQAQSLAVISDLAKHMDTLLSDLSDLSQIEVGQMRMDRAELALPDVVERAMKSVRRPIAEKAQQLVLTLPPDLPALWADHVRVTQILTNLLSNASKYTPAGGAITLSAGRTAAGDMIEVAVRDTGIGLSLDDQGRIFEKFFRSADSAVRQERGTGLGLNITRLLVEAHGGTIWFTSALGVGTTFAFTLPLAETHCVEACG
jgi:signal transduction histidine kinase